MERERQSLVSSVGSLRPGDNRANLTPRNNGRPDPCLIRWTICPNKALKDLMTTLNRPLPIPIPLGPTYLSLPLHLFIQFEKKILQASHPMSCTQPPGDGLEILFDFKNSVSCLATYLYWEQLGLDCPHNSCLKMESPNSDIADPQPHHSEVKMSM